MKRISTETVGTLLIGCVSLLLAVAAVLKFQHAWSQSGGAWTLMPRILAGSEMCLALWLVWASGMLRKLVVIGVVFSVFTAVAASQVYSAATSCGCFGDVTVTPWLMCVCDALIALMAGCLVWMQRAPSAPQESVATEGHPVMTLSVSCAQICALVLATAGVVLVVHTTSSEAAGSTVIMAHQEWVGRQWPHLEAIDASVAARVQEGRWVMLVARPGCSTCERVLPEVLQIADNKGLQNLVVIDLPASHGATPLLPDSRAVHSELKNDRRWIARTPLLIVLDAALVLRVEDDPAKFTDVLDEFSTTLVSTE